MKRAFASICSTIPSVHREEIINGKTRFIVRIDANGSPVFRVARDAGFLKNRESGQLIKADSLYPGGSLGVNITGTGMTRRCLGTERATG